MPEIDEMYMEGYVHELGEFHVGDVVTRVPQFGDYGACKAGTDYIVRWTSSSSVHLLDMDGREVCGSFVKRAFIINLGETRRHRDVGS